MKEVPFLGVHHIEEYRPTVRCSVTGLLNTKNRGDVWDSTQLWESPALWEMRG
jgi:hypothetical protein